MADSIEDELFSFQARYKSSIYSHETALNLCDLTDRPPIVLFDFCASGLSFDSVEKGWTQNLLRKSKLVNQGVV